MNKEYRLDEKHDYHDHRWVILVAIGLFTFMSTLDGSIVNVALPTISADLGVKMNQAEWVVSIYLMTVCACLLLFGKIGDSKGKVAVFKWGTVVFVIGSALCGIPGSLSLLLVARAVQAVGASMTMATGSGIITEVFPLSERGKALGLMGSFVSLGSITGPGVGGLILHSLHWSYIFWINIPVGIVTIIIGQKYLPKESIRSDKKIDKLGFIMFAIFIMTFFGGVFVGQEIGFQQRLVWLLMSVSLVSLITFYRVEKSVENPLINFKIFHNKMFTMSLLTASLIFVSNFFANVIVPFYLQNLRGFSPSKAGMIMMVFPLVMVVVAPLSGMLSDKVGPMILCLVGLSVLTLSQFFYTQIGQDTPLILFVFIPALMGLGNALFQAPNNTIVMSSVTIDELGIAGSLNSLARNFGMVVGISLSTTVLYQSMSTKFGSRVTTYLTDRPDVFLYGMHVTYLVSFSICLAAFMMTLWRYLKNRGVNRTA
ncbi:MFS transporter [Vagococcus intermedius]|uniref:MFS transporter n=1 Tax=Vagococcus intermedius TaxID=2991418 RepID=A0AAF0CVF9_9ENTE|nr:MFS transporter [Vagococcus intermedius]WEG73685.1 MFS transporter [Vagococcus intermedius]WEG75769.1 MFS transporter [Vagococcus intermedius]